MSILRTIAFSPRPTNVLVDKYGNVSPRKNIVARTDAPEIDHAKNRPWRDPALGYKDARVVADNGAIQIFAVEDLVYVTCIGPLLEGARVCHFDGNPANNAAWNLVLMTPEEAQRLDALSPDERRLL